MKQILSTIVLLICCVADIAAQQIDFQKTYSSTGPSNQGSSIIEQANGDFIICGVRSVPTSSSQYIGSIFLFRIKSNGDTIWTKEIGTFNDRELGFGMTQLPNNNLVLVGSINTPPNAATTDALIVYTDINGNTIWQKRYGGNALDYATDVAYDGSNIIVCGRTESYGAGDSDAWLLKLNLSGDTLWTKTFGGAAFDDAQTIIAVNNEYVITGGTYSFAAGQYDDAWVIKLDSSGKQLWRKTYGLADRVDWAWTITPDINNGSVVGYVFVGVKNTEEAQPGNARGDLHFVKIDLSGNVVWDKTIQGTPWRREGYSVKQLSDRGFIISGYKLDPTAQSQQMYVLKTDNAGDVVWDTAYGNIDSSYQALDIVATNDGGWAITGAVFKPGQPIRYIFVTKYSNNPTGIAFSSLNNSDWEVYPNPSTDGLVHVRFANAEVQKLRLLSIDGSTIKEYEASYLSKNNVDFSIKVKGLYILEVATNKGVVRRMVNVL
ncbi:MAG: T9SS type A sorting domain-containing protein [Flavipsychrobacter sp.]